MVKKIIAIISAMLLIIACTGCGSSKLKGEWAQSVAGVELYSFNFSDKTVEMKVSGASTGTYDYEIVDDDTIKVSLAGVTSEWEYSISGDKLTLNIGSIGTSIELTRK